MTEFELEKLLISIFPGFGEYWDNEDINRESDKIFTAHGLRSSFFFYCRQNLEKFTDSTFYEEIEKIVASGPDDKPDTANTICTSFLEMIVDDKEGKALEPYLGKECKKFYGQWLHLIRMR